MVQMDNMKAQSAQYRAQASFSKASAEQVKKTPVPTAAAVNNTGANNQNNNQNNNRNNSPKASGKLLK